MKSKIDPEELKLLLEQDKKRGRTDRIAAHFGVKKQTLRNAIKRFGFQPRPQLIDIEKLKEFLSVDKEPGRLTRAARLLNTSLFLVRSRLDNFPELKIPSDEPVKRQVERSESAPDLEQDKTQRGLQRQREMHGCLNKTKNYRKDQRPNLCREALTRAIDKGIDFDLHPSDIVVPEICPVLGIPIIVGAGKFHPNCPNLDRVDSSKGYTWDNVLVISCRANVIKSDATVDELEKVSNFLKNYEKPSIRNPIVPIPASTKYKISEEQKEQLRQEFANGEGIKNLAAKYNVSYRIAWELTEPIRKPPVDDK